MTRAQQAGLRLDDVPRASLAKIARERRLDAQVRQALGLVLQWRKKKKQGRIRRGGLERAAPPLRAKAGCGG